MDPPPLPSRAQRFLGWWRVGLCAMTLATIITALQNDDFAECSFSPLIEPGFNHLIHGPPPRGVSGTGLALVKMFGIIAPVLTLFLYGGVGGLASLYVACRWQPTPRTTWLTACTLAWSGLLLLLGLTLRYRFGEEVAMDKGHPWGAYMLLWPLALLVLSGGYAALLGRGASPPRAPKVKQ